MFVTTENHGPLLSKPWIRQIRVESGPGRIWENEIGNVFHDLRHDSAPLALPQNILFKPAPRELPFQRNVNFYIKLLISGLS